MKRLFIPLFSLLPALFFAQTCLYLAYDGFDYPAGSPLEAQSGGPGWGAGWYVQVGAFGKQQSIDRLARKLHGAGYTRVCVAAQDVRGLRLFYVGPYRNADAARAARDPLRKLTGTEGLLRKLP